MVDGHPESGGGIELVFVDQLRGLQGLGLQIGVGDLGLAVVLVDKLVHVRGPERFPVQGLDGPSLTYAGDQARPRIDTVHVPLEQAVVVDTVV